MDVFLSVLSVAGIILGAVLLIMIISFLLSAILYESVFGKRFEICLLYTSPSPRDRQKSRMPSSA